MNIIPLLMVVAGAILLGAALLPATKICQRDASAFRAWKFLGFLIVFFIVGYAAYAVMLARDVFSLQHLIVAAILLGGGVFVITVVSLSSHSIAHIDTLAIKERHRATHDMLTGLANRALFQDRLDYSLLMSRRNNESMAVLMMDLDRFKEINDSLGHFYGDYILQEVGLRLGKVFKRELDIVARFGGDEFVVLLHEMTEEPAIAMCRAAAEAIDQPFHIEGHNLNVGVSIGIALFPNHALDSELLIQCADIAMYEAKRSNVTWAVFDARKDHFSLNRLILLGQLRDAVTKKQFVLHYQPKFSTKNNEFCGVEALIRWNHPDQSCVLPKNFIPQLEQGGLMKTLTTWVLDEALRQCAEWESKGKVVNMAVNLSVKNLHDFEFPETVAGLLNTHGVDPQRLILEITESAMIMDQKRVLKVARELKALNVKLSIDDFGTGYSSISYLRKFPFHEIKIDRSFVGNMLKQDDDAAIIQSTIDMIHCIGGQVVAEGVEDKVTEERLAGMGCDYLQGYHVCHPMPAEELEQWLFSDTRPVSA